MVVARSVVIDQEWARATYVPSSAGVRGGEMTDVPAKGIADTPKEKTNEDAFF